MANFETAFQLLLPHFMEVMSTRNYNGHAYMIIGNEWKTLHRNLFYVTIEYFDYFKKNEVMMGDVYNRLYPHVCFMGKAKNCQNFQKRVVEYIVNHVPNSAVNDDMTQHVSLNEEFIERMKRNILLPEERLLEIVGHDIPEVLAIPAVATVVLKYIDWFTHLAILDKIRKKIGTEFKDKKAVPTPTGCRGFRPEDDQYFRKRFRLDDSHSNIKSILEDLFFYEMKTEGLESTNKWLQMYCCYFRIGGEYPMFCENWEHYFPEFMSDSTNYLTHYDKKTIESIPLLLRNLLQNMSCVGIYKNKIVKNLKEIEKRILINNPF
jgi:hypothetical protein